MREGFLWRKLCYVCSTTTTKKHAVWFRLTSSQERELRGITQRAGYVSPAISGIQSMVLDSSQVSIWVKGPMAAEQSDVPEINCSPHRLQEKYASFPWSMFETVSES